VFIVPQLQEACSALALTLDCTIEGVASDSVVGILQGRVSGLLQDSSHVRQTLETTVGGLERTQGELAASSVRCSSLQEALGQYQAQLATRDTDLKQMKVLAVLKHTVV